MHGLWEWIPLQEQHQRDVVNLTILMTQTNNKKCNFPREMESEEMEGNHGGMKNNPPLCFGNMQRYKSKVAFFVTP